MTADGEALPEQGIEATPATSPEPAAARSYFDVELTRGGLNLFERQGDGKTAALLEALKRYGLHLSERVSSPCG